MMDTADLLYVIFISSCGLLYVLGMYAVWAPIYWFLSKTIERIPPEFRDGGLEPRHPWLCLIPLIGLYWNFQVFLKISQSFQNYFHAHNYKMAKWYCICAAAWVVPLGVTVALVGLILLIITLIKYNELRNRLPELGMGGFEKPHQTWQ